MQSGDEDSLSPDALLRLWYERLTYLAERYLESIDRKDITLLSVVNDAVAKWLGHPPANINDERHALALLHNYVRQVVLDRLKHQRTLRAGGNRIPVPLHEGITSPEAPRDVDIAELDDALNRLAAEEDNGPRLREVLILRLVCGLSVERAARFFGVGTATITRDYRYAIARLRQMMIDPPA